MNTYKISENIREIRKLLNDISEELKFGANSIDTLITDMEFSVRTQNCLRIHNIHTIRDLLYLKEKDILKMENMGRKSLNEIKETLSQMGLGFGMEKPS